MKLKRFLLRYFPPGVILEYELRDKSKELREIDLLNLTPEYYALTYLALICIKLSLFHLRSDVDVIVNQIALEDPLVTESKKPHLRRLVYSTSLLLFIIVI